MFFHAVLLESIAKKCFTGEKWRLVRAKPVDDGDMSCSCFGATKYSCLKCKIPICNKYSIFEEDKDYHGWVAGKSVAF